MFDAEEDDFLVKVDNSKKSWAKNQVSHEEVLPWRKVIHQPKLQKTESWWTSLRKLPSQPFGSQYPLFSFCDSWATMTRCNRACVKPFAVKKSNDFRTVLLKIKGAVWLGRNHTHYFPIPVLLKQNQKLPKRLGVGRAWMIEQRTLQHR